MVRDFCSTCVPSQLSYDEYTDRMISVGILDGEGEDWPPALICRGKKDEVANTLWPWLRWGLCRF